VKLKSALAPAVLYVLFKAFTKVEDLAMVVTALTATPGNTRGETVAVT
jgi:hypothetical protein